MATPAGAAARRPGRGRGVVAELTLAKSGQSTPLTAISLSSDQRVGVVGGHGIMKVITLAPEGLSEVASLKTGRRKGPVSSGSKLSMYDVSWCPSGGQVAASLSNGGVAIWDLQHLPPTTEGQGLQGADVRGEDTGKIIGTHERSVNRLSWNPFHHNMLLSGSQDGYLKIWDTRMSKEIATFDSRYGAVRDVQFSPLQEYHFAAVFDNGKLQLWDYKFLQPKMKIACHTKSALSVSWHHTLPWRLLTSSHKLVKVWDLHPPPAAERHHQQRQQRQQQQQQQPGTMEQTFEATITLHSPGVVSRAKWRPGHPNQIATAQVPPSLGDKDCAIMVQDVTDPDVALFALYGSDRKNGFCWLDTPLLPPSSSGSEAAQGLGAGIPLSSFVTGSGGGASGLSMSSSGKGWRAGASGEESESEWRGGMGTWQHIITCSDRGKVCVHSLAKSTLPRRNLEVFGTNCFKASSRGEMTSWLHKRNNDPNIWKIYQNKDTQASPGIYQEDMLEDSPGIFPQHTQKISRSLSVGDQTGGTKGRRTHAGSASSISLGGSASGTSSALHRTGSSGLPRSPGLARGQSMSGALATVPHLGLGSTASVSDDTPPPPPQRPRSPWTVYPVPDKPVALDVVNWRRIRRREHRWIYGAPQPRTNVQRAYGPELTEHLTKSVLLRGYHVRVLAAHNTEVYLRAGLESMAHTWRMLGIMLAGVPGGLLLPLGANEPDIDVAGIDAGIAGAAAAAEAAASGVAGGIGRGGLATRGRGRGRDVDAAAAGREGDFSVPEVLDLIDRHEEEEQEEEEEGEEDPGLDRQLTPEQRQQWLHRVTVRQQPGRAGTRRAVTASGGGGGGGGDDLKLPPRRPRTAPFSSKVTAAAAAVVSDRTTVLALTTPSESVSSSSRHGAKSNGSAPFGGGGGGGGGSAGNGSTGNGSGVGGSSMWRTSQSRLLQPADASATNMDYDGDDDGRDDSDLDTTNTTTFAANESVWWEPGDKATRGGGGGGGGGGGDGGGRPAGGYWRPERQERLPDEVTLDWLWKSEIRDWLTEMSSAGFAYDTVAVLEVVRSWYYGSGPGRDEDAQEGETDPEEMCDIKDAPGFWLGTDIPNLQVRMWYMQALEKLWQLQLHSAATDIIKHCADPYIAQMHRQSMTISIYCTGCGSSRPSGTTSTWCSKCAQHTPVCPLCDVLVVGRYVECPGCHHGGHADHMMSWFSISRECPVETCFHECVPCMPEVFKLSVSPGTASEPRQWQEFLSVR